MPLTLDVDGARWRAHLRSTASAYSALVPVAKGNGYGFGCARLARRASWLGVDMLAVGTYREVATVEKRFAGSIMVLEPWRPFLAVPDSDRLIHTIGRPEDLAAIGSTGRRPRVVLEAMSSLGRHGFELSALPAAARTARGVRLEGYALHLPLGSGHVAQAVELISTAPAATWFVSHLSPAEVAEVSKETPRALLRPRVGTQLWLGDRGALSARATVLDVHRVRRGQRAGYRQRTLRADATIVVVSGGTAHGVGLEAPSAVATPRDRAAVLARGGLVAAGRALSPFTIAGRRRWFLEPPHMQVSMIVLPDRVRPPAIGDEVAVEVRFTTTIFDAVTVR